MSGRRLVPQPPESAGPVVRQTCAVRTRGIWRGLSGPLAGDTQETRSTAPDRRPSGRPRARQPLLLRRPSSSPVLVVAPTYPRTLLGGRNSRPPQTGRDFCTSRSALPPQQRGVQRPGLVPDGSAGALVSGRTYEEVGERLHCRHEGEPAGDHVEVALSVRGRYCCTECRWLLSLPRTGQGRRHGHPDSTRSTGLRLVDNASSTWQMASLQ